MKKSKGKIILAAIVAIVILIIAIVKITGTNTEKNIREEYAKIVDARIEEYLNADEDTREYANELGLKSIEYEITDIFKEDGIYILNLEIDIECEDDSWETTNSLLAYEVEEECFELLESFMDDYFTVGEYKCSYYTKKHDKYFYNNLIFTSVNGEEIHAPQTHDTSKNKDTVKCQVCDKSYQKGSENAKSISRTNMCSNCYSNFKWTQDAIKELPVD